MHLTSPNETAHYGARLPWLLVYRGGQDVGYGTEVECHEPVVVLKRKVWKRVRMHALDNAPFQIHGT